MTKIEEVREEEVEEEEEEKHPKKNDDILVDDIVLEEAVKDVEEAVDEDIAQYNALSNIKSDVAKELRDFLEECEEVEMVVRRYIGDDAFETLISGELTMKDAIALAMKLMNNGEADEEFEPSPYVQALLEKVMRKLTDCRAFKKALKRGGLNMLLKQKGEPKYAPIPEELLRTEGRKI